MQALQRPGERRARECTRCAPALAHKVGVRAAEGAFRQRVCVLQRLILPARTASGCLPASRTAWTGLLQRAVSRAWPTVMRGRSARIARPAGWLCIRASMLLSAAVPVVSPSAATRSARRGLRRQSEQFRQWPLKDTSKLHRWQSRWVGALEAGSDGGDDCHRSLLRARQWDMRRVQEARRPCGGRLRPT